MIHCYTIESVWNLWFERFLSNIGTVLSNFKGYRSILNAIPSNCGQFSKVSQFLSMIGKNIKAQMAKHLNSDKTISLHLIIYSFTSSFITFMA